MFSKENTRHIKQNYSNPISTGPKISTSYSTPADPANLNTISFPDPSNLPTTHVSGPKTSTPITTPIHIPTSVSHPPNCSIVDSDIKSQPGSSISSLLSKNAEDDILKYQYDHIKVSDNHEFR